VDRHDLIVGLLIAMCRSAGLCSKEAKSYHTETPNHPNSSVDLIVDGLSLAGMPRHACTGVGVDVSFCWAESGSCDQQCGTRFNSKNTKHSEGSRDAGRFFIAFILNGMGGLHPTALAFINAVAKVAEANEATEFAGRDFAAFWRRRICIAVHAGAADSIAHILHKAVDQDEDSALFTYSKTPAAKVAEFTRQQTQSHGSCSASSGGGVDFYRGIAASSAAPSSSCACSGASDSSDAIFTGATVVAE
jgi:hypothetical protein